MNYKPRAMHYEPLTVHHRLMPQYVAVATKVRLSV
jgi:hypothetical protein